MQHAYKNDGIVVQPAFVLLSFSVVHCCCELTILYSPFSSRVSVFTNHELYVLKKAIIQLYHR